MPVTRRVVIQKPGGYGALKLVAEPAPGLRQGVIRVKVRAAGVNYADCIVRMGYYEAAKGRYPITPGFEFAGVVEAVGAGVSSCREGDRVLGLVRFGGYADRIDVEDGYVWPCPDGWDFADCAAFPAVHLTAYYALFQAAKVERGETLLVHSAAGGVGTALLQQAAIHGCRSIAVVGSAHKADLCRELGAAAVIDRASQDLWPEAKRQAPEGYDAIFDANGVTTPRPGFEQLAQGGRLVIYGFAEVFPKGDGRPNPLRLAYNARKVPRFSPLEMTGTNRTVAGFNVIYLFQKRRILETAMKALLGWIREGRLRKTPVTTFPLERAADAHKALESGRTVGKLVLTPLGDAT